MTLKAKVLISGQMDGSTKDSGWITACLVKDYLPGATVSANMMASTKMAKRVDLAACITLMEGNILGLGKTTNKTEKESI